MRLIAFILISIGIGAIIANAPWIALFACFGTFIALIIEDIKCASQRK